VSEANVSDVPASVDELSFYGSFTRKNYTMLEQVFHINYLHRQIMTALACSLDPYRYIRSIHLHVCVFSEKGGVGKSTIWHIIQLCRAEGTVSVFTYQSAAAATGGVGDNVNMSDFLEILDELSHDLISGDKMPSEAHARLKMKLSEGFTSVEWIHFNDEGRRVRVQGYVENVGCMFCSTNITRIPHALRRRFLTLQVSENPSVTRHLSDTMNQEALDCSKMGDLKMRFRVLQWQQQAMYAHVEKLIHSGALPDVSKHVCGILNLSLMQKLRQNGHLECDPNVSEFSRINILARNLCIGRCLVEAFLTPNEGPLGRRALPRPDKLTPRDFRQLERRLFVTVEDYVGAIGLMVDQLIDPFEHAVRAALRRLYERRLESSEVDFDDIFYKVQRQYRDLAGNVQCSYVPNYAYVSWDMALLVGDISGLLPDLMNGMEKNDTAIKECLLEFTQRQVASHSYERCGTTRAVRPCKTTPRVTRKAAYKLQTGHGGTEFTVHVDFLPPPTTSRLENDGWQGASPTVKIIGEALQDILCSENMLPRTLLFTNRSDVPHKVRGEKKETRFFC